MHRIETEIAINSNAERVWGLLTDFASYPTWNPFILSVEGKPEVGGLLEVNIQPPGSSGMRFRPIVLAAEPNRELRWKGKFILPGLFDGEHCFRIESRPDGGIVFYQEEIFTGILVFLFRRSLDGATKDGFIAMNEALRREAERS